MEMKMRIFMIYIVTPIWKTVMMRVKSLSEASIGSAIRLIPMKIKMKTIANGCPKSQAKEHVK